ncbi:MAG: hypothetical protein ACI97A_000720 [Planctomycetota bacterium]|jgi:hypothetical protein
MMFYQKFLQKERRQLNVSAVVLIAVMAITWFSGLLLWEASDGGLIPDDPQTRRNLVSSLCRTGIALISTVFACLFLAIPLTANMYTPQLISVFVRSWTNILILCYFVSAGATCLWTSRLDVSSDTCVPILTLALLISFSSLVLLLPYLFSVFRFLSPRTIVARLHDTIIDAMSPTKAKDVGARQEELGQRIRNLGNVILRAVERSDREVALSAVEAICSSARHYEKVKKDFGANWYEVSRDHFPGLSAAAIDAMAVEKNWVEREILLQLSRAYTSALAKIPDVISAISRSQRQFALTAAENKDSGALSLTMKYFNNFLREAIVKNDTHAVFDLVFQLRVMAERLWATSPESVLELSRRLHYYANMAHAQNLAFARDLIALDLGRVIGGIAAAEGPITELVSQWLLLDLGKEDDRVVLSPGIAKARLLTEARLRAHGKDEIADSVRDSLIAAQPLNWDPIAAELLDDPPELFWEVTDRQENLSYSVPEDRPAIKATLALLSAAQ